VDCIEEYVASMQKQLFEGLLQLLNDVCQDIPVVLQGNAAVEKLCNSFIKHAKLDRKDDWRELTYTDIQHIINTATKIFGPGMSNNLFAVSVKLLQNTTKVSIGSASISLPSNHCSDNICIGCWPMENGTELTLFPQLAFG
jgi:hypothetical protein